MKSTMDQLRRRGYAAEAEAAPFAGAPSLQLCGMLQDDEPVKRTIAAMLLGQRADPEHCIPLCAALAAEKKLYPRLAMAKALAAMGAAAVPHLAGLLGALGSNQHRAVPEKEFRKKSYPLPRDLAARILARMGPAALPGLEKVILTGDRRKLLEAIDAIGFIAFYHGDLRSLPLMLDACTASLGDDLLRWKIIRALQSFPGEATAAFLKGIIGTETNPLVVREAGRSLSRIQQHTGGG